MNTKENAQKTAPVVEKVVITPDDYKAIETCYPAVRAYVDFNRLNKRYDIVFNGKTMLVTCDPSFIDSDFRFTAMDLDKNIVFGFGYTDLILHEFESWCEFVYHLNTTKFFALCQNVEKIAVYARTMFPEVASDFDFSSWMGDEHWTGSDTFDKSSLKRVLNHVVLHSSPYSL